MKDDQLNDCLVVYIEKNIFIDIKNEKIIQKFYNMKNRRRQLLMLSIYII